MCRPVDDRSGARLRTAAAPTRSVGRSQGQTRLAGTGRSSLGSAFLALAVVAVIVLPARPAAAAVEYDAVLEWNGPIFRVINRPGLDQLTDVPATQTPFSTLRGVATRLHGARKTVYVLDAGNERIQMFEANAAYQYVDSGALTFREAGVTGASEWDTDEIQLPQWAAAPTNWIVPRSELVILDGDTWTWVSDLTGFTADDQVYTIDYDVASNGPEILFPTGSLDASTTFRVRYLMSDNQTGATDAFGIGDLDYGSGFGGSPVLVTIDATSGGPTSFESLAGIDVIRNEDTSTSDDLFVVDAADASAGQNEELVLYSITQAGVVSFIEAYDDSLATPSAVAVERMGASTAASVTVSNDSGPFDQSSATVIDDSQVTGHTYSVQVGAPSGVTITDLDTGRVIIEGAGFFSIQNPFLGIPGLSLPKNILAGSSNTITTTRAVSRRFVFVADAGADRIKVISASDGTGFSGDWLPGDSKTGVNQPGAGIGDDPAEEYTEQTPGTVPINFRAWTATFPIAEGSLETLDINGTWTRVDDLSTAGPADQVYTLDWTNGLIQFGDGVNGRVPDPNQDIEYSYRTTPDVLRYGSAGSGAGQFDAPAGIAARWNSTSGHFDVYVADTGNHRIQKLAFHPEDTDLHLPASIEYITSWSTGTGPGDPLLSPTGITVRLDLASPSSVWIAVTDAGNDRVVLYRDAAAQVGSSNPPSFAAILGEAGSSLGEFQTPAAVSLLASGDQVEIYTVDASRNVVTKFQKKPTPAIEVDWALADCYPNFTSYVVSFAVTEPPTDGWVDLYFDTVASYDPGTAKLAITAGTVSPDSGSLVWSFPDTPTAPPANGTYYLFAKLRDSEGAIVASDSTTSSETVCIDSSITPTSGAVDGVDGDATLYLQNGSEASFDLTVQYADSVIGAVFVGSFDPALLEIRAIVPGTPWEGTGSTDILFTSSFDNTAGTFQVNSSALGTPIGLVGAGPFVMASVNLITKNGILDSVTRYRNSVLELDGDGSRLVTVSGIENVTVQDLDVRVAYLGDIATTLTGAAGSPPQLAPRPDGIIDFDDVIAFTLGWKGANLRQDPIADLGPTLGTVPNLRADPDGVWDIEDLLAFTAMYSWAAANGYNQSARFPGEASWAQEVPSPGPSENRTGTLPLSPDHARVWMSDDLSSAVIGEERDVEVWVERAPGLHGVRLQLSYDPTSIEVLSASPGELLQGEDGSFFFDAPAHGVFDAVIARLDRSARKPEATTGDIDSDVDSDIDSGVDTGPVCRIRVRYLGPPHGSPWQLGYDLRDGNNQILGRVITDPEAGPGGATDGHSVLWTRAPFPNPASRVADVEFGLARSARIRLEVFDASGRQVRTLHDGLLSNGDHRVPFDLQDDRGRPLHGGLYLLRISDGSTATTHKLVIVR